MWISRVSGTRQVNAAEKSGKRAAKEMVAEQRLMQDLNSEVSFDRKGKGERKGEKERKERKP